MTRAAKSVFAFSFVFLIGGLGLLLAPQFILSFLGFRLTEFLFPRFLGMALLVLAYYYVRAARGEVTEFFKWSVHARLAGVAFYGVVVLCGIAPLVVLGFALMDLLGALWAQSAIAAEKHVPQR
jgi:hypothetical protein